MKYLLSFLCLIVCIPLKTQDVVWTDKTRILPDALRQIPEMIFVRHSPNPNYPESTTPEDKSNYKYVWRHSTSVVSPEMTLRVKYAGSYIWYNEEGWKKNVLLDRKKFAKRFNCPKGVLEQGITYTFQKNYRWGDHLYGGDALWYIIAEDESGNLYRGIAILETEAEIKTP